ncbi:MAG: molecular chaperone DnaJ [Chamaesiphon sp.]|nr:molecular chaperone DnaJ [Chamaesiphon sp.]
MSNQLTFQISPENEELHRKNAELAALETDLVQGELDLTTLHVWLQNFEREYQQIIGTRYAELEHIQEQIAEYMAYLESANDFKPSEDLKKLYREVAKRIHPDLTTDLVEKNRRQELMREANQAYEVGDVEKLRAILYSWESNPESVQGQGIAAELIRSIRKIAQCRERLAAIQSEISEVKQTELYQLQLKVTAAQEAGQDLLADMAQEIEDQIEEAQVELQDIKKKSGQVNDR